VVVAADTVLTIGDRTEARVRAPDPATNTVALDLDTLLDARLASKASHMTYLLADMPRFTLLDYNSATRQGALMDSLQAAAEWSSPRALVRLEEVAAYGQQSIESLSVLPAPGAQATPPPGGQTQALTPTVVPPTSQSILFASSLTSVTSTLLLKPWTLYTRVGYQLFGGADSQAQKVLPFQQGPIELAMATYQLTGRERDRLITIENGTESSFSNGPETLMVSLEEQWRRNWARSSETWLGFGWAALRARTGQDTPDVFASDPIAEAAFDQKLGHGKDPGELLVDVRLAPQLNPLSGLVDEQIRGTVQGRWGRRRLSVRLLLSAAESLDQAANGAVRQLTAELGGAYTPSDAFIVDAGIRGLYQSQNLVGTTPISQVILYVAVNFRALKVKF
jgi:hypothetical protein